MAAASSKGERTETQRAYQREYMKALRDWRKAHKVCSECGKQDAYTLNGWRRCYECNEKHKAASTRYERRKGRKPFHPAKPRQTKSAELGIPKEDWRHHNLCVRCGSPLDGVMVAWDAHGKKSVLCSKCYQKTVEAAAKGRAARAKKHGKPIFPPFAHSPKAIASYRNLLNIHPQATPVQRGDGGQRPARGPAGCSAGPPRPGHAVGL